MFSPGDDSFGVIEGRDVSTLYGGDGNDSLATGLFTGAARLDGGNGDDILVGAALARDHLIGEAGNDTLFVFAGDEATGGTGSDRFVMNQFSGVSAFICDLQSAAGPGHDVVDLWAPLNDAGYAYNSFTEVQAAGTLGVTYLHGYTYLSYDSDGDHVPDHEIAHIKGVVLPDQLDQTFLVSYEDSYSHSPIVV